MNHNYPMTVAAARAETDSKFKLAEALATEIPPRERGPKDDRDVVDLLTEARDAIVEAGGETRSVRTLERYRQTALWVSAVDGRNFRWSAGISFTAHDEARMAGMSYEEFAALDAPTARMVRNTTPDAVPTVTKSWSPAQRREAAKALLSDPEIAQQAVREAVMRDPQIASAADQALEDSHKEFLASRPVAKEKPTTARDDQADMLNMVFNLRRVHRHLSDVAAAAQNIPAGVKDKMAVSIREEIDWIRGVCDIVEVALNGGPLDEELRALLDAETGL